jgi:hypothetical protein
MEYPLFPARIAASETIDIIAGLAGVDVEVMLQKNRGRRPIADARTAAMYTLRNLRPDIPYETIADAFRRDHSTVIHAVRATADRASVDPEFAATLKRWVQIVKQNTTAAIFYAVLKDVGAPLPEAEFRFHPVRRWRFDYAWPAHKLALEVEGGVWTGGRHTRGAGFVKDMEKYNEAAAAGWRLIRCVPDDLRPAGAGKLASLVKRCLTN